MARGADGWGPGSPSMSWDTRAQGLSVFWDVRTVPARVPRHMLVCCRGQSPQSQNIGGRMVHPEPENIRDGPLSAPRYWGTVPLEPPKYRGMVPPAQKYWGWSPLSPKILGDSAPEPQDIRR